MSGTRSSRSRAICSFGLKPAVLGELIGKPFISNAVFVGRGTIVEQGAMLKGPAWIGENCHIRSGCYVRENVIVGDGVVMGNSCEFKNCILFDEAQVPHFNYVGDSILGYRAHLGAGVILSNVKLDHREISVNATDGKIADRPDEIRRDRRRPHRDRMQRRDQSRLDPRARLHHLSRRQFSRRAAGIERGKDAPGHSDPAAARRREILGFGADQPRRLVLELQLVGRDHRAARS